VFSDSGRSYAFDHRASGFGRGEGVGCLVLKPLDAALSAGDAVRAVIAGSGVNQDGRTRGITLPNSAAQESLIRSVYKTAHIDPSETGYVEAHGTGTRAGDPLEAAALHAVFGKGRTPKEPLFVGSVKTNVGHTEGASGVISVIKTAMMLEKGFVLPNCGFQRANEDIPLDKWNIKASSMSPMNLSTISNLSFRYPRNWSPGPAEKDMPASTISVLVERTHMSCWSKFRPCTTVASTKRLLRSSEK